MPLYGNNLLIKKKLKIFFDISCWYHVTYIFFVSISNILNIFLFINTLSFTSPKNRLYCRK